MKKRPFPSVSLALFDETSEIHQSPATMHVRTILWALLFAAGSVWAQTNRVAAPPAGAAAVQPASAPATNAAPAQSLPSTPVVSVASTNERTRPITLDEAIQLAVEHNFDVKVQRIGPEIAHFNLAASYGVYDPNLNLNYNHTFNSSPGGFTQEGIPLPSTEIEQDNYSAAIGPGVSGYLPTGTRYQLSTFVNHSLFTAVKGVSETYTGGSTVSLQQPLLRDFWIDASRANILINKRQLKISEWALRQQMMQSISAVETAYYNLIFARENVTVQAKALEYTERLLMENRKRVQVGAMAPLDEQQAQSQVATTRAQLIEAGRALDAQENILKNLISDNYLQWHDSTLRPAENLLAVPETFDIQESWRRGLAMRPDLQQAKLEVEKENITLRYQKNQLFPGLDLVGSYGGNALNTSYSSAFEDSYSGNNPRYSAGVIVTIPLANQTARNRYKATKKSKEQLVLRVEQLQQNVLVGIDDAIKLAQSDFARISATREARAFAEAALDAEAKKLENGKSTSFLVLQAQRDLTSARFEEIRALAEYNIALAQLAFQEGRTLERRNLNVKVE